MNEEWQQLIKIVSKIVQDETGNQISEKNISMVESRLSKRFLSLGIKSPSEYSAYLEDNLLEEKKAIISMLTTHHSFFFREYFHFEDIEKKLLKNILIAKKDKTIRIWSSASSQGQEAYSLSMFFHRLKLERKLNDFDFKIIGTDIDHESIKYAQNGVYIYRDISHVPMSYIHGNWLRGKGEIRDYVKPKKHIKDSVLFEEANLLKLGNRFLSEKFDIIFCRNVLIYFHSDQIKEIIKNLLLRLEPHGILVLGISESIVGLDLPVKLLSNSIYCQSFYLENEKQIAQKIIGTKKSLIRVLCVDDSPTILVLMKKILSADKGFEVVATAVSAKDAREKLKTLSIDIVTLDIHMPEETGIDYLRTSFTKGKHPPVLIVSSIERDGTDIAKEALDLGASDYVEKPDLKNIVESSEEICFKIDTIIKSHSNSILENNNFKLEPIKTTNLRMREPIKVLIVDDSQTIRMQLKKILSSSSEIKVVGELEDPRQIDKYIQLLKPDVITLDINMPYLNGIDVLKLIIPRYKIPTIVVSALNLEEGSLVMEALELGAIDFFQKPEMQSIFEEGKALIEKIIQAKNAKISIHNSRAYNYNENKILDENYLIAIGSSTGGTEALKLILEQLPSQIPPILIVQHIPRIYSKALAERLNNICPFDVVEAENNEILCANKVYIAPGNYHMTLKKTSYKLQIQISDAGLVNGHRPSVDVLFNSIAEQNLKKIVGVILTGMGKDGARGLKQLKECGAKTIAQNEETCVVFGMPHEAIKLQAVDFIEPLENISNKIISLTKLNL
ncbi:chemotaxis-specific protein-glutamate methyltransferase CheB [Fluviispira multicolorata]|uniref:Protein-glutamate methylesterase/protein-glutamine glutaminase n=1 Tax=Fluviispira multicolorata TaxID=2654512 RepID=A0A833JEG4_9BACT|nr:chemotaxis-specific protein-glutamate methyltransferase CheB [Fluviispira multicolorata]KAB8029930.1 chemotaxis-specific protein-glutamate methyltransferase CheB [Fluviispira multicolorata]